ncbi:hypothetical protein L2E82_10265 [Cichorium intybus]|uniref:Uncharacterized protein n=1 Tax=Cichorium intybus TaxID=13427 RepID=A0ACB9GA35_CICIN|nr:hypothetical protein L2E82_10265 [Cichorium intybus]
MFSQPTAIDYSPNTHCRICFRPSIHFKHQSTTDPFPTPIICSIGIYDPLKVLDCINLRFFFSVTERNKNNSC